MTCSIAPLDQSATQLGWSQGAFTRRPCPLYGSCMTRQLGLQFLADGGTPVIAPFDARVTRESGGLMLTLDFPVPPGISPHPARVRVTGISTAVPNGLVEKGALLGRVSRASRPAATFELLDGHIAALFADLGLDVVGAERPTLPGYGLTPMRGGRLLARSADCSSAGLRGLEGRFELASAVPSGYVEPDQGAYSRFGPSRLTNVNASAPPGGSNPSGVLGAGVLFVGGALAWWMTKR